MSGDDKSPTCVGQQGKVGRVGIKSGLCDIWDLSALTVSVCGLLQRKGFGCCAPAGTVVTCAMYVRAALS